MADIVKPSVGATGWNTAVDAVIDKLNALYAGTANQIPQSVITGLAAALTAKADLIGGKLDPSQLPALAISDTFVVADQAAMLALTAQRGDIAIRQDRVNATPALPGTFILTAEPASTVGNWFNLPIPGDAVASVAGRTGAVTLTKNDVGLPNVDNTSDATRQAANDTRYTAKLSQRSATATSTTTAGDNEIVPVDTSGGTFTVTGPLSGQPFGVRWRAGTAAPTVAAPSGYTIAGQPSITMGLPPAGTTGELVAWQAFGSDYQPITGFKPQTALQAALQVVFDARYVAPTAQTLTSGQKTQVRANVEASRVRVDGVYTDTFDIDSAAPTPAEIGAEPRLVPLAAPRTTSYTAAAQDYIPVDTTSGNVTITFPTAPADGTTIGAKHVVRGGTNTVLFALGTGDALNVVGGSTSGTLLTLLNQGVILQYKASSKIWYARATDFSLTQLDLRYAAIGSGGGGGSDWQGFAITTRMPTGAAHVGSINGAWWLRVTHGSILSASKIALTVVASSGSIEVAVYRNTGTGVAAKPGNRVATSGTVACPVSGYAEIPLLSSVSVAEGDWLYLTADNTTATFLASTSGVDSKMQSFFCAYATSAAPSPATAPTLTGSGRQFLLAAIA